MSTPGQAGGPSGGWGSGWTDQAVSLIILIAEAGGFSGFFVYSPTPGFGNLIGSWAAAAGEDPFGNPYNAGLSIGKPGDQLNLAVNATTGVGFLQFLISGGGYTGFSTPNISSGVLAGTSGEFAAMAIRGGSNSLHEDSVFQEFNSSDSSSFSNISWQYSELQSLGGTDFVMGFMDGTGFNLIGNVLGVDPNTGTSSHNPAVGDSVHAVGFGSNPPFQNGWSIRGVPFQDLYYIAANKNPSAVHIKGCLAGNATPVTTIFTLPAAYIPATTQTFPIGTNTVGAAGQITVNAVSGAVNIQALQANVPIGIDIVYDLDI
jgi:hypothetical protein